MSTADAAGAMPLPAPAMDRRGTRPRTPSLRSSPAGATRTAATSEAAAGRVCRGARMQRACRRQQQPGGAGKSERDLQDARRHRREQCGCTGSPAEVAMPKASASRAAHNPARLRSPEFRPAAPSMARCGAHNASASADACTANAPAFVAGMRISRAVGTSAPIPHQPMTQAATTAARPSARSERARPRTSAGHEHRQQHRADEPTGAGAREAEQRRHRIEQGQQPVRPQQNAVPAMTAADSAVSSALPKRCCEESRHAQARPKPDGRRNDEAGENRPAAGGQRRRGRSAGRRTPPSRSPARARRKGAPAGEEHRQTA